MMIVDPGRIGLICLIVSIPFMCGISMSIKMKSGVVFEVVILLIAISPLFALSIILNGIDNRRRLSISLAIIESSMMNTL